jgi:hypothetical protein
MRVSVLHALFLIMLGVLVGGGALAAADSLLTSKDIKDGSLENRDIRKGVITQSRLSEGVQEKLEAAGPAGSKGAPGAPGTPGVPGPPGTPGAPAGSAPTFTSGNFGIIYRNTIGSPVADLRRGPADPPVGSGSLNILVGPNEKVSYGVSVRGPVTAITEVGFRVYTTGENISRAPGAVNLPQIAFEINPNLTSKPGVNYSTLVWFPPQQAPGKWSDFIDGTQTGVWGLTGSAFNDPPTKDNCGINGPLCTFDEVKKLLNDGGDPPQVYTAGVTKGRDFEFQGAVDDLRLNGRKADFEEGGIVITGS